MFSSFICVFFFLICVFLFLICLFFFICVWPFWATVPVGHRTIGYFSSFYFLNVWSFLKSLFWMKQIRGSVRVKIKEYGHAWFEFLFVSLLVIFNFFPQINHFYYFTSLHGLRDVENHCTHLQTGRKSLFVAPFFSPSRIPVPKSAYKWACSQAKTAPNMSVDCERVRNET